MKLLQNIQTWPAVIIAYPRTGSTVLAYQLAAMNGLSDNIVVSEPNHAPSPHFVPDDWDVLKKVKTESNGQYILKIMVNEIQNYQEFQDILANKCFKICLFRRNKVEQIISMIVSRTIKKWHWSIDETNFTPYDIDMSKVGEQRINEIIAEAYSYDQCMKDLQIIPDIRVAYEDLNLSQFVRFKKTPKPTNFLELRNFISKKIINLGLPEHIT